MMLFFKTKKDRRRICEVGPYRYVSDYFDGFRHLGEDVCEDLAV